jgi:2-polyprenyl-3-methyl-5-hydroxy-6-metoxy-1,4-benzoquinol methylase
MSPIHLLRRVLGTEPRRESVADAVDRIDSFQHQVVSFQHQVVHGYLEPTQELLDLTLRRLNALEGGVEELRAHAADAPFELSARTYSLLNYEKSHLGFAAQAGLWLNHPIAVSYTPDEVRWVYTNERIIENPFVLQGLSQLKTPARILDVGPLESLIPLHLSSLGHKVTALDVRPYRFAHPNLTVVVASILDWHGDGAPFDAVILLSTLEHIGLGAYGQAEGAADADMQVMARVRKLLRPGGVLMFTSPFGRSRVDETQRVYSGEDLVRLLKGFRVTHAAMASRRDMKTWTLDPIGFEGLSRMTVTDDDERVALVAAERE